MHVIKKDGTKELFALHKVQRALVMASSRTNTLLGKEELDMLSRHVRDKFTTTQEVDVNVIHKEVENTLMAFNMFDVAREYIGYRATHKKSIFNKRTNLKPYEYPQLLEYVDAIRHSYWVHTEFNYQSDIQDFKVKMNDQERQIVTRAMLAISQIEVAVKTFWAKVGDRLPKPEVAAVGVTFGESEVRHADAYSNLIELLGLNSEFAAVTQVPAIKKRIAYLEKSLATPVDDKEYFKNILLFSVFIENISLFSQFLIMMSFNKHGNMLKGISNAVQATSKEEDIHAKFGMELINIIKEEHPDYWSYEVEQEVLDLAREALDAEYEIIQWIFEDATCDYVTTAQCKEFITQRMNKSLKAIGLNRGFFFFDKRVTDTTEWFDDEVLVSSQVDFFYKRSTSYNKKSKAITEDDLF